MNNYEGPRNGDYVAYVDRLLRANPEFRRASNSIASAVGQASATPGSQSESPLAQMRERLEQAGGRQLRRTGSAGDAAGPQHTQATVQNRTARKRRPWVSPFVLFMIVVGAVLMQVLPPVGAVVSLMAWFSLIGSLVARLRGK
jgi:hypothetical protein